MYLVLDIYSIHNPTYNLQISIVYSAQYSGWELPFICNNTQYLIMIIYCSRLEFCFKLIILSIY